MLRLARESLPKMPSFAGHCGNCGVKIEKQHNYCHQCGHILKCPHCSGECDSSFNFCPHCGKVLRPEKCMKGQLEGSSKLLQIPSESKEDNPLDTWNQQSPGATSIQWQGVDGAGDSDAGKPRSKEVMPVGKACPLSPISQLLHGKAKITCTVGAYNQNPPASFDVNNNSVTDERTSMKHRYTSVLKLYAGVVRKLRGEEDFQQPVRSRMQVVVTHVEKNGYFFWGQIISDSLRGNRTNIETLERISHELQHETSRPGPVKYLGRCAALEDGVWYRAWNSAVNSEGKHDVLYIDFGNTAFLSSSEICMAAMQIWNLPPMAKPFRLIDTGRKGSMKDFLDKKVTLEILSTGNTESNYVASVYLVHEDAQ